MSTIRIDAAQYADHDDCLAAAASDYAEAHDLQGWDLEPRWEDDRRDAILLTAPTNGVTADEVEAAFSAISQDAIGTGADADGEPNGSDDWDHESAAAARQIAERLGMVWEFSTWADARSRAISTLAS